MRYGVILLAFCFNHAFVKGQCPPLDVTWASINTVFNSNTLSGAEKLAALTNCLRKIESSGCGNDSTHVRLLRMIGFVHFDQSGFSKAIHYFRESLRISASNSAGPGISLRDLMIGYYWLSTFYDSLNNTKQKLIAVDSCISVSLRAGLSAEIYCVRSLATRTAHYFDLGDYHRCMDDAQMCERLAWTCAAIKKENADAARQFALTSIGWLVEASVRLNEFEKAEAFLGNKIEDFKKSGLTNYLGFAYAQLGQLAIYKGRSQKALLYLDTALRLEKQAGGNFTCKQILNTIGYDIYFRQRNDAGKALQYYNKALRYVNKEKQDAKADAAETLNLLTRTGNVYVRQGDYGKAFRCFQQAFDFLKPGMTENAILHMPADEMATFKKTHILAELVIDKGDAFLDRYRRYKNPGDAREAIRIYKVADRLLVLMRANHADLASKLFWRSQSRRLYEQAIEVCHLLTDAGEAFYFFEKSRAALLSEQLAQQNLLSAEDRTTQMRLEKKMLLLERERDATDAGSQKRLRIESRLFLEQQSMDGFVQSIKAKNPLYYQSGLDTSVAALKDVRRTIFQSHQAVLETFCGDSAVYTLLITPDKTGLQKINKAEFDEAVNGYTGFISNSGLLNKDFAGYKKVARHLYQMLFQNTDIPRGRIIISPDGRNFPFESLIVKEGANANVPIYFLNEHAVSYTYSVRYLLSSFTSSTSSSSGDFMGIAPVNFNQRLSSLPGSEGSLSRIASYFGNATNLVGAEASKNGFASQFSTYSVIHLYAHAAAKSNVGEPVIYFADSALRLSDLIPESKPVTKLIVLSACETGNGQAWQGEGIFTFSRGFAACGIPSSVSNLWSVDNEATYTLTELFYKHLSHNLPLDVALQRAKKEFIETGSRREQLPYYWAAAILMGRTEALQNKPRDLSASYLLFSGLFCLFAFGFLRYKGAKVSIVLL